jgi:hypothetical protein
MRVAVRTTKPSELLEPGFSILNTVSSTLKAVSIRRRTRPCRRRKPLGHFARLASLRGGAITLLLRFVFRRAFSTGLI